MKIGFIGQGYVGKAYADNFEARGFDVVRYSLDPAHQKNKIKLKECNVVFIAVPTPTNPDGHDHSIVVSSLEHLTSGTIVVIKSTVIPGTTRSIQSKYKKIFVLHSPEFLTAATARYDTDNPKRNIIGIPFNMPKYRRHARFVLDILQKAPAEIIVPSVESEFMKYAGNTFYYVKTVYINVLYNLAQKLGVDWANVKQALAADPWIGPMHVDPIHKTGRGAGGHCLIKDYAAFKRFFGKHLPKSKLDLELFRIIERKNLELLTSTGKDLEILENVYGKEFLKKVARKDLI